jgi:hypothetical protein
MPELRARRLARRWATELWTNRPRRLIPVELAGRAAALVNLRRAWRDRTRIMAARIGSPEHVTALLREPNALGAQRSPQTLP